MNIVLQLCLFQTRLNSSHYDSFFLSFSSNVSKYMLHNIFEKFLLTINCLVDKEILLSKII